MKKKALVLAMAACLMAGMVGCSKGKDAKKDDKANSTTTTQEDNKAADNANQDAANADANMDANADANMDANADANMDANADANMDANAEQVVTEGTFKSGEEDGEFKKATFTDAEGNDFVALINVETELPDEGLLEGKKYKVHHDNMAAMTDPQEFTNVTKIEIAE